MNRRVRVSIVLYVVGWSSIEQRFDIFLILNRKIEHSSKGSPSRYFRGRKAFVSWVKLVLDDLFKDLTDGNDLAQLNDRLIFLPDDLDELIKGS